MGKTWVLDTETKGTGAHIVPLDRARADAAPATDWLFVPRRRGRRADPAPEVRQPLAFKVVDVMTRQVLGEGLATPDTVELLEDVRSVVDVRVFVWEPDGERWRPLTLAEQKALWAFRGRARAAE
jgi:hypothetical protein